MRQTSNPKRDTMVPAAGKNAGNRALSRVWGLGSGIWDFRVMSPALILLAAGGSTRMGRAKQLLPYRGVTLLRHGVNVALASRCCPVAVVVGSQAAQMQHELSGLPVRIVINQAWANGMGGSIRAGLAALLGEARPPAVVITLCDQPAVTAELLNQLIDRYLSTQSPIVACAYDGIAGVPALFDQTLFAQLANLNESTGARELIRQYGSAIETVSFPQGSVDVDTPEEYGQLK